MKEYATEALVLDTQDIGELDKLIYLYTQILGLIKARAKSARKITSKLAGHLQPLKFITVRLVEKNGLQIADALSFDRLAKTQENLRILKFIKEMNLEYQKDPKIWYFLKNHLNNLPSTEAYKKLLEILGFSPQFAQCAICKDKNIAYFSKTNQIFFCKKHGFKISKNEVILII
jgi:DNA repair protein RecO (recombination protein O)